MLTRTVLGRAVFFWRKIKRVRVTCLPFRIRQKASKWILVVELVEEIIERLVCRRRRLMFRVNVECDALLLLDRCRHWRFIEPAKEITVEIIHTARYRIVVVGGGEVKVHLLDNRNRTQKWDESPC